MIVKKIRKSCLLSLEYPYLNKGLRFKILFPSFWSTICHRVNDVLHRGTCIFLLRKVIWRQGLLSSVVKGHGCHFYRQGKSLITKSTQIPILWFTDPPKPSEHAFEFFGLVEGAVGRVPISIEANPKPTVIWTIGGETIFENTQEGRYTVEPTISKVVSSFNILHTVGRNKSTLKGYLNN